MRRISGYTWEVDSAAGSAFLLLLRLMFAGLMILAAISKLKNPLFFAQGLTAFDLIPSALIPFVAFLVPWTELIAGVLLLVGIWGREAAATLGAMIAAFTLALTTVLISGKHVECGCFGDLFASAKAIAPPLAPLFEALGDGAVSEKTIVRNLVFFGAFLGLCFLGEGRWALNRVWRPSTRVASNEPESAAGQPV